MDDDRMSVSSGSSDTYEPAEPSIGQAAQAGLANTFQHPQASPQSPKRTLQDGTEDDASEKRMRLSSDHSRTSSLGLRSIADDLPAELWQRICLYLTPPDLGRLMCVSKRTMSCLDGSIASNQSSLPQGRVLKTIDAESIWATWRITNPEAAANMPKPLDGRTERDMWKLIRGVRCDACGKLDAEPRKPISPDRWHAGPTMSTTRAVWPFALRLCGECLFRHCEKDTTLLCTPAKQFRSALPYAFVTHDFHYIPTTVLKEAGQAPSGLHVEKQYFKDHVDHIMEEWKRTLAFGQGATEEWLKGLSGMGAHTAADSARWEHWEAKGGLNRILFAFVQLQPAPLLHPTPTPGWVQNNMLGWPVQSVPPLQQQFGGPQGPPPNAFPQHPSVPAMHTPFSQPQPQFSPQAPFQNPYAQPTPLATQHNVMSNQQQRQERNPRDAEDAKAARRQQIEQRCLTELEPAIPPNVLRHMPSFQAAIKIGFPLNDASWEALKPKLLEQRDLAMAAELETTRQLLAVQQQVQADNKRQTHHNNKDTRDTQEKEWEEKLRPQRERLGAIADEHVRQQWRGGQSVNSGNVARFAMSVFDQVRKIFYSEQRSTDQIAIALGQPTSYDPPDGPFLRKLTLETMKWVYDHKIRPLTRDYGKEIFFCNGAGCEFTNKHFAFEGVIQHYGAKHTNDYSKGNVIVHWQSAEWPEELPFYDPGSGPTRPHYENGGYSRGTTVSPQMTSGAPFNVPSAITSPYGWTPQSVYGHGLFPPPPPPPPNGNAYVTYNNIPVQNSTTGGIDPTDLSRFFSTTGTGKPGHGNADSATNKDQQDQLSALLNALKAKSVQPASQVASGLATGPPDETKPDIMDTDIPDFEVYQDQLKFIADTARFAWSSLNAVHGMPSSVRVFAVLQYTVLQFSHRFSSRMSIDTFAAALMNNPAMEPIKQASDLHCNLCQAGGTGVANPLMSAVELPSLTYHFQSMHAKDTAKASNGLDQAAWVKEMIALPPTETVPELINAPGMTDDKLSILADAFPGQLPRRLPRHKDVKDISEGKQTKKNKRYNRKPSNGRRNDFDDANLGDTEESGHPGFHESRSPPDANGGNRRSLQNYENDDDEYDPSKPGLSSDKTQKKRRDFARKSSGMGSDLAALLQAATEQSNQAAAEENRRRGIVSEVHAQQVSSNHSLREPVTQHLFRGNQPISRPTSAYRPAHEHSNDYNLDERRNPYMFHHSTSHTATNVASDAGYSTMERGHGQSMVNHHIAERTGSQPPHILRDGYDESYNTRTPPSASRKSRYARYEEQYEQILRDRTRSRSPIRHDDAYRTERPVIRQREYLPQDQPPVPYRYANEMEPVFVDPNTGRRMRLVRIEDDAPPPGYPPPQPTPGQIEYHDRQSVYDPRYYERPPEPQYALNPRYDNRTASVAPPVPPTRNFRYAE